MKKKLGVIITLLTVCICLMTPQMHAKAASGKTTIAVSAGSLNIGQTVTVTAKALSASGDSAYANMVLTYDAGILEFVSCNATYGGGGGSISVECDIKSNQCGKSFYFAFCYGWCYLRYRRRIGFHGRQQHFCNGQKRSSRQQYRK